MLKPTVDTFKTTRAAIALRILISPLAQFLRDYSRDMLTRVVASAGNNHDAYFTFLNVEFRRAGTSCELYVQADEEFVRRDSDYEQDKDGNEYRSFKLATQVNWPMHGSVEPVTALARLKFYEEVTLLAADIQATFGGELVWKLHRTKEEREKQEAALKEACARSAAVHAMEVVRSGMRVNSAPRPVPPGLAAEIPIGTYEHEFADGKKYALVAAAGCATVSRVF